MSEKFKIKTKQYFNKELHIKFSKKEVFLCNKKEARAFKKKLNKLRSRVDFFLKTDDKHY